MYSVRWGPVGYWGPLPNAATIFLFLFSICARMQLKVRSDEH
jgi:hypothetical protein